MAAVEELITNHIDIWTSAIKHKSSAGRGGSKKIQLYGVNKLRELILDLAVRGLLVPQNPNDEPASELLKRIAAEKAELVKTKKIKKQKPLPPISAEEMPFELPLGWDVERLGNLVSKLGSGSTPRGGKDAYVKNGVPFLRSQNVWNDGLKLDDIAYIPKQVHDTMDNTKVFPGDVLLNITGASLGRSTIFPEELKEANVSQHVTIIRLLSPEMNRFILLGILSPMIQKFVWGRQVGMAIEGLSKKVLEAFEFPIPPLEEQHRIVAKVDELMALCDQLERQTESSIAAHQTLVETLLNALTENAALSTAQTNTNNQNKDSAEPQSQFEQAWQCIAEHFDTLFTTAQSIEFLEQTILQLAVMGKLVPQDPSDESASELLKRIAAEKAELVKAKKIKKKKALPKISEEEEPFKLPDGWMWVPLGNLISLMDAGWSPACIPTPSPSHDVWGVLKTTAVQAQEYIEIENKELPENLEPRMQYEVKTGDILITRAGPKNRVGISCLVETTRPKLMISDKIIRFHLVEIGMSEKFISLCLNSGATANFLENSKSGMAESQMNISQVKLKNAPIPICPIAEQIDIVNKVDELMTLCNQLKAHIADTKNVQLQFADTVTDRAIG